MKSWGTLGALFNLSIINCLQSDERTNERSDTVLLTMTKHCIGLEHFRFYVNWIENEKKREHTTIIIMKSTTQRVKDRTFSDEMKQNSYKYHLRILWMRLTLAAIVGLCVIFAYCEWKKIGYTWITWINASLILISVVCIYYWRVFRRFVNQIWWKTVMHANRLWCIERVSY